MPQLVQAVWLVPPSFSLLVTYADVNNPRILRLGYKRSLLSEGSGP